LGFREKLDQLMPHYEKYIWLLTGSVRVVYETKLKTLKSIA
jgi:hypothetical protein